MEEVHGIVIVGGGISGLATALALHRKGLRSIVLEKSENLRTNGVCIAVHANGWRALDQLGIGTELRETANLITGYEDVWLNQKSAMQPTSEEVRCLKQKDLVEALAKSLPPGTIRFGRQIAAITGHGHCTHLRTVDGSTIKAKALIGCDGANSEVAKYLGLGCASQLPRLIILGLTSYPHGHPYGTQFQHLRGEDLAVGRLPLNENLVHFFITRASPSTDISNDASAAKEYVLEKLKECPADIAEMVLRCDPETEPLKTLTKVWYRHPCQVLFGRFQRGTVTVAGDAMHAMGPFIGQGGSAALEDAVVLARSLAQALPGGVDAVADDRELHHKISAAFGKYVTERRPRVFKLSLEAFVTGAMLTASSLAKYLIMVPILVLLGSESRRHTNYDCGRL